MQKARIYLWMIFAEIMDILCLPGHSGLQNNLKTTHMKINYVFVLACIVLALGCGEGTERDTSDTDGSAEREEETSTEPAGADLTQNGNYATLFNSPDCKVMTAEEISAAIGITVTDMNIPNTCSFESPFPDGKKWYLSILRSDMRSGEVQREIETFKSDETGQLAIEVSETGDTYLCIQHLQGYLSIYNPNYNGSVLVRYGSVGESRGFTPEARLEHQAYAKKIANALLRKYQQ